MQEKRPIAISRRFEPFDLSTRPPLFFGVDDPTLCQNQGSRTHATQIITNVSSRKSERLCCARSSTPQWVYDAGAISHGVTASNLVLARILTDTLISRSPHCVLGARYDGNVNLFYVVMTGLWQTEGLDGLSRYKLYQQQLLCREQRKRIWHAQSGNVQGL